MNKIVKVIARDITEFSVDGSTYNPNEEYIEEIRKIDFLKIIIYGELLLKENGKVAILTTRASSPTVSKKDTVFLIPEELIEKIIELKEVD